jgi:hypothetical protein
MRVIHGISTVLVKRVLYDWYTEILGSNQKPTQFRTYSAHFLLAIFVHVLTDDKLAPQLDVLPTFLSHST